jgi:hypothetical protein
MITPSEIPLALPVFTEALYLRRRCYAAQFGLLPKSRQLLPLRCPGQPRQGREKMAHGPASRHVVTAPSPGPKHRTTLSLWERAGVRGRCPADPGLPIQSIGTGCALCYHLSACEPSCFIDSSAVGTATVPAGVNPSPRPPAGTRCAIGEHSKRKRSRRT